VHDPFHAKRKKIIYYLLFARQSFEISPEAQACMGSAADGLLIQQTNFALPFVRWIEVGTEQISLACFQQANGTG
jgi:hypothetical protein